MRVGIWTHERRITSLLSHVSYVSFLIRAFAHRLRSVMDPLFLLLQSVPFFFLIKIDLFNSIMCLFVNLLLKILSMSVKSPLTTVFLSNLTRLVFCVKDYNIQISLLRCNSDIPLYSITSPLSATSPQAMISSVPNSTLWHHRLRHLGNTTHNSIISYGLINCSKVDMPFCHACQLGKHTRLLFDLVISMVSELFEIIHYDLLT